MLEAKIAGCVGLARVRAVYATGALVGLLLMAASERVSAQSGQPVLGSSGSGQRGLVYTGLPLSAAELNLSIGAGYGVTDSFEPVDGVHHRGQATFGAAFAPMSWLSFALRLDGRLELHPDDGEGSHAAGFGDPRIFARVGQALSPELQLGAELGGWFPGTDAPSLEPSATSAEVRGLFGFTPQSSPWVVLTAAGFRLDNSARSAPDLRRLRQGDRISLGISDSNSILAAAGVARRFGRVAEAFTELSADVLVGGSAPSFSQSPLRASLGGRYFVSSSVQLDLTAIASLSSRPGIAADAPLVPIEPRLLVLFGVRYSLSLAPTVAKPLGVTPATTTTPKPATAQGAAKPQAATVSGTLLDDKGEPLPEAAVMLRVAGGEVRDAITDAQGRYTFQWVPVGPATVEVTATGFRAQSWDIEVRSNMPEDAARALTPKVDTGVMRGLIRTFQSEPLRAQILVRDRRGKTIATRDSAEDGHFELDLPPGAYEVTISARGYRTHRRSVRVEGNGVSILNVDMREAR